MLFSRQILGTSALLNLVWAEAELPEEEEVSHHLTYYSMSTVVPMGFAEIRESVIVMSFVQDPAVITHGSVMLTLAVSERISCRLVYELIDKHFAAQVLQLAGDVGHNLRTHSATGWRDVSQHH